MRSLRIVCGMMAGALLLCAAPWAQAAWYYRVIARDDSPAAQTEKLRVRDAVIQACPQRENDLPSFISEIKKAAESVAPCRVEIKDWSPDTKMPLASTVYITIGEGRGHNCWGVLYADSLRMAQAEDIPEEPEKVEFVWPVWRWILSLFGL